MKTVKVKLQMTIPVEVDVEVSYDKINSEAIVVGGEISPTFKVRARQINANLSAGDFQRLDRSTKDRVLEESLELWRASVNQHPSTYPEEGIRTVPMAVSGWEEFIKKESGLHLRIHTDAVVKMLKGIAVLAEPALEREPSLYLWEMAQENGQLDLVEERMASQLRKAKSQRMPDGSLRVYWEQKD